MATELFIGGVNDGSRMEFDGMPIVLCPLPPERQDSYLVIATEEYRREAITTSQQRFHFYVSQSLTIEQALERLFNNYQPKP